MKLSSFASGSVAIAFLGACASVQDTAREDSIDTAKVAAIDNAARAAGVTVQWINYPRKKNRAVGVAPAMPAAGS